MKSRLVLLGVAAILAIALTAPALGGANAVSNGAASAKTTAQKALAKAKKADKRAKAAQASADAANSAAAAAQSTADSALAAANSKFGSLQSVDGEQSGTDQGDKIAIATCPGTTEATGGGYVLSGGDNAAYVQINFPYGTDAWYVDVNDNGAVDSAWSAQAWVNCIS
jgi:hypothetical protein